MRPWFLYIARCADGTLYTGITTGLARREAAHNAGQGARYTRSRCPVSIIAAWKCPDRSTAQRAEARLRRLPHRRKLSLIAQQTSFAGCSFYTTLEEAERG